MGTPITLSGLANGPHHVDVVGKRDSGWYVLGPEVQSFEREYAAWCGATHAVGVGNGTDALQIALMALNLSPGDEVIIPLPVGEMKVEIVKVSTK